MAKQRHLLAAGHHINIFTIGFLLRQERKQEIEGASLEDGWRTRPSKDADPELGSLSHFRHGKRHFKECKVCTRFWNAEKQGLKPTSPLNVLVRVVSAGILAIYLLKCGASRKV